MPMEQRFCGSCKERTWHNSGKKEAGGYLWRCTGCGSPVPNSPQKREFLEEQRKRLANRAEMRRKLGV